MKSNPVQYTIISLVIADCLIIVVELLIDMDIVVFPEEDHANVTKLYNASHPIAYRPGGLNHSDYHGGAEGNNWVVEGVHYLFVNNSSNHTGSDHHDEHHHTNKEKAQHVLHMLSLAILSVFMVEVCLKIFVERSHLLKQKAEVFDAIVVIISFTLDVIFTFVSVSSAASDAAGLMVLLRLWRVTRIINGVVMSVKHDAKMKMAVQKKISRKLEHENKKLKSKIEKLERDNALLRKQLRESQTVPVETCNPRTGGCKQKPDSNIENEAIEMQNLGGKT
ncbi:voltage-gated hydrogen channel 1 [Plakobranchus ocellatus]|uniref:Voltage-gated hydrogen channel 1 n=1 Tax=Plakobranchus ocellatus TaxID=259542 RepID=A0AAV4BZD4_9GAST|nr:voltage-gated hydrogen channel 1 [Plakobranchus ocellatus]